jgi:hypothetical protein
MTFEQTPQDTATMPKKSGISLRPFATFILKKMAALSKYKWRRASERHFEQRWNRGL